MNSYELNDFYESKIPNTYERAFVVMLTKYIIFDELPETSPTIWQDAEIEARVQDGRIPFSDDEEKRNGWFALATYSVHYLAEKIKKDEIINILNAVLSDSSREPLAVFEAFGKRFGKDHIFSVFFAQHRKRIPDFNPKIFAELFKYPCWLEFSEEAKRQIHAAILDGRLSDQEIDYYLGVGEEREDYADLLPVIKYIVKDTDDSHLFWTAGDILNLIWLNLPDDEKIQKKFRKEIYDMFWPRIGNSWPIINHDSVHVEDENARQIFEDSYGWLTSLSDLGELNPELKDVHTRLQGDVRRLSLKKFLLKLLHSDGRLEFDDDRIQEMLDNFDEVIEVYQKEESSLLEVLIRAYSQLCYDAHLLADISKLEKLGDQIASLIANSYPEIANRCREEIERLTSYAKNGASSYHREQQNLKEVYKNNAER